MENPRVILLFSGKRKSGKDYICEKIKSLLSNKCTVIRISGPLKSSYARTHNLNIADLMSDGPYKENYRLDMIIWSDKVRNENPGYFCKAACEEAPVNPVWIVTDIRRKTDIKWFQDTYDNKVKTIRIYANLNIRKNRGWTFQSGVDDATSECDLDDWKLWDLEVTNNNLEESQEAIKKILEFIGEV